MADNFDKWRPTSKVGKYVKATDKVYNDPKSGHLVGEDTVKGVLNIIKFGFEIFGGKK